MNCGTVDWGRGMIKYKISSSYPIPKSRTGESPILAILRKLKIGQSLLIEQKEKISIANFNARHKPKKLIWRGSVSDNIRVWRVK